MADSTLSRKYKVKPFCCRKAATVFLHQTQCSSLSIRDRAPSKMALFSSSPSPIEGPFEDEVMVVSSSPPSSPCSSLRSSPFPDQPDVDYSRWTPDRFATFPGYISAHDHKAERSSCWKYGYRMRDQGQKGKVMWVCAFCFNKRAIRPADYRFVASTSSSIERHLKMKHKISVSTATFRKILYLTCAEPASKA
jgi:hypothetical protein